MGLITTWNTIPFYLELIVDFDPHAMKEEDDIKLYEVTGEARKRIGESYPTMDLDGSTTIWGQYGGEDRGPALHGKTDVR